MNGNERMNGEERSIMERRLERALAKTKRGMARFTGDRVPVVTVNGSYEARLESFFDTNHWTFSFFTGCALHGFHHTGDPAYLRYLYGFADMYERKVFHHARETMHDLGFLYSLYAVAMHQTTGDPRMKRMALKAADELAKRFLPNCGILQAWDPMDELAKSDSAVMIADTMMNLPLLFWAWRTTGNVHYKQIAMAHADTTIARMLREDGSIFHAYRFRVYDGSPEGPRNYCGFALESAWARGTAWAIYGFVLAYRYTERPDYERAALRLLEFYRSQLPDDGLPPWDFRLPGDRAPIKDVSAAAIVACALLELHEMDGVKYADRREQAGRMIEALSAPYYFTDDDAIESVLVNFPDGVYTPEQLAQYDRDCGGIGEVGTVFGDYFYIEALMKWMGKSAFRW